MVSRSLQFLVVNTFFMKIVFDEVLERLTENKEEHCAKHSTSPDHDESSKRGWRRGMVLK